MLCSKNVVSLFTVPATTAVSTVLWSLGLLSPFGVGSFHTYLPSGSPSGQETTQQTRISQSGKHHTETSNFNRKGQDTNGSVVHTSSHLAVKVPPSTTLNLVLLTIPPQGNAARLDNEQIHPAHSCRKEKTCGSKIQDVNILTD